MHKFNLIFYIEGGIKIKENKFRDIRNIFNISRINEECVIININKMVKRIYIYEIEPVSIFNFNVDIVNNICTNYTEFLREFNVEFQILISNYKMDIGKYMSNFSSNINISSFDNIIGIYERYVQDMTQKLKSENIYVTKFYIVVAIADKDIIDINEIDNKMNKIISTDCGVKKIRGIEHLINILYSFINKERIYE